MDAKGHGLSQYDYGVVISIISSRASEKKIGLLADSNKDYNRIFFSGRQVCFITYNQFPQKIVP